jgi:hypothetical protein
MEEMFGDFKIAQIFLKNREGLFLALIFGPIIGIKQVPLPFFQGN